jgi:hypothetical protein
MNRAVLLGRGVAHCGNFRDGALEHLCNLHLFFRGRLQARHQLSLEAVPGMQQRLK